MDCQEVSERLPWLLNGSLSTSDAEALRTHLAGCPRCREEMEETRRAAEVFGAHLSTRAIVDLAWERPTTDIDPEVARAHVETCPDCREELALARESRGLDAEEPRTPDRRARPAWYVLPATLAAGLALGFVVGTRKGPGPEAPPDRAQVAQLQGESIRLRERIAALETAARETRPRINLPLFEVLPDLLRRGGPDEATEVRIPAGAAEVALFLSAEGSAGVNATLVIADGAGREVWRADGLVPGPPGGYVVTVPAAMLPDGAYRLAVRPQRGAPSHYRIRVRR